MRRHYKVIFLAMSCNDPFFEMSRKVVHDTWAKPLIENRYPDYAFFSYTSSSQERIEDNCIYVNEEDDINHTYSKTIRAIRMLKESGITWDNIVRTNTSTFINIEKTLELVERFKDGLCSFSILEYKNIIFPSGWYMILPSSFTDKLIEDTNLDENHIVVKKDLSHLFTDWNMAVADDVLLGIFRRVVIDKYNIDIPFYSLDTNYYVQHYKSFISNPYIQNPRERFGIYGYNQNYDPDVVNKYPVIQVRLPGVEPKYRYIELEYMYELNNKKRIY